MKTMASTLFWVGACCTPDLPERGAAAKLRKARFAPLRGGLRPGLTELGGSALRDNGGHAVALAQSMKIIFGIGAGDVTWAAADVGWTVGHSYVVYAPLLAGATSIIFEGKPVG